MKPIIRTILLSFLLAANFSIRAQNEDKGFSFQGYARDFEGAALSSQTVTVQFTISEENAAAEYAETHTVETDPYGVFSAIIGKGTATTGDFGAIEFGEKNYWLKVDVKAFGSDFVTISNTELHAVPYAKSSRKADNGVPPGTILPFAGSIAPDGYLLCDGTAVSTATYPDLFEAIQYNWGGSGATFRLPDLRGTFLRGVSGDSNEDPDKLARTSKYSGGNTGNEVGTYQTDELRGHTHTGTTSTNGSHTHTWNNGLEGDDSGSGGSHAEYTRTGGTVGDAMQAAGSHNHTFTTASTGGAETRPKNAYVLYIIKY